VTATLSVGVSADSIGVDPVTHTAYVSDDVSDPGAGDVEVITGAIDAGPVAAGGIFVRSDAPAGEADLVTEGPGNTLQYYEATPGSPWYHAQVAGTGTTYSG
jgi:hypothetical protein